MARWVCDYCGETGTIPAGELVEQIQCPVCGEPVLPLRDYVSEPG